MRETARLLVGQEMVHEVVAAATTFLEARNQKPESLLEQGISRRTREEEALRSLRMDAASMETIHNDHGDDDDVGPPKLSVVVTQSSRNVPFNVLKPAEAEKAPSSLRNPSAVEKGQSWLRKFISTIDGDGDDNDDDDGDYDDDASFMDEGRLHAFSVSDVAGFGREAEKTGGGSHSSSSSRYLQEFVEIGQLGTGSSGQVCKVRNRLDRRVYAVKKIDLTIAAGNKIRREVTTLSRLIHKHVVRYFAAWVEQYDHAVPQQSSESASCSSASTSAAALGVKGMAYSRTTMMDEPSLRDIERSSRYSTDSSEEEEEEPRATPALSGGQDSSGLLRVRTYNKFFHYGSSSSDEESSEEGEETAGSTVTVTGVGLLPTVAEEPLPYARGVPPEPLLSVSITFRRCLFIQMEYCYTTLRQVIDNGKLWRQHDEIFKLLRQVLEALLYVHERGVIHRDLKVCIHPSIPSLQHACMQWTRLVVHPDPCSSLLECLSLHPTLSPRTYSSTQKATSSWETSGWRLSSRAHSSSRS